MTQIPPGTLDVFCPMHVVLDNSGHIVHSGPTLQKMWAVTNRRFLEAFELKRPRGIETMDDLAKVAGMKLHLKLRKSPYTELKGVAVQDGQNIIVNLSFGISVVEAVREYSLNSADFAATDLTIEMLYLVEAKSAAMEASRKLNQRLQGAKIAAEEQAFTDTLTGLKNRRAVDHILGRNIEWDTQFALMQIDLDWFKAVNDTYGHAAGDHVLQTVARILVEETRDNDTVARIGGDEFVIMLPNMHDPDILSSIGNRIIQRLSKPVMFQGKECRISASIGTALYEPGQGTSADAIMDDADTALYASKNVGRGRHTFYNSSLRDELDAEQSA